MYKSFKFVLFNESFPNPAKFEIRPNFGQSQISAGFVKKCRISAGARAGAELRYSHKCKPPTVINIATVYIVSAISNGYPQHINSLYGFSNIKAVFSVHTGRNLRQTLPKYTGKYWCCGCSAISGIIS